MYARIKRKIEYPFFATLWFVSNFRRGEQGNQV